MLLFYETGGKRMSEKVISLENFYLKAKCRPQPLLTLFQNHSVVLVGDEVGAFYLDPWAITSAETCRQAACESVLDLWERRSRKEAVTSYMELVYAAYERGVRDIVLDMPVATQVGLEKGLERYRRTCEEKTEEDVYRALLAADISTPMDGTVQMAGALGMRVYALNGGFSGIATLFREARGITKVPSSAATNDYAKIYDRDGLQEDVQAMSRLLRRKPTEREIATMRSQMLMRLEKDGVEIERKIFDEQPTVDLIQKTIDGKPFLGFFQKGRLFSSGEDLDEKLRGVYGDKAVARVSLAVSADENYPKYPQYVFHYSIKSCSVSMTEEFARSQSPA